MIKHGRMRIRIHPTFVLYLLSIALFSSCAAALCSLAALLIHEAGHGIAAGLLGEQIASIELTPFGGMMAYAPEKSPHKGIQGMIIAAAGPLANYLLLLLLPTLSGVLRYETICQLASANFAMLCINLLPVLPLDGGRIVFCVGYYFFRVAALISLLTALGVLAGILMIGLAIYGAARLQLLNLSLIIVGGYLILCAWQSRTSMLADNLYTVVQERSCCAGQIRRAALYAVAPDVRLHALLDPMERAAAAVFMYEDASGQHLISEKQICRALIQRPSAAISQVMEIIESTEEPSIEE